MQDNAAIHKAKIVTKNKFTKWCLTEWNPETQKNCLVYVNKVFQKFVHKILKHYLIVFLKD